jgi:hypothetical protein
MTIKLEAGSITTIGSTAWDSLAAGFFRAS